MASYLVMKNNLRRILTKKSTYLLVVLIPLLLAFIGSVSVRLGEKQVRLGIVGDHLLLEKVQTYLGENDGIQVEMANLNTIHTDQIMGKYHYVLSKETPEMERNKILEEMKQAVLKNGSSGVNDSSYTSRMLAMLLTVYMTIATIYALKYIQDKEDGALERFLVSGSSKRAYVSAWFMSNFIIIALQLLFIIVVWMLFDSTFVVPVPTLLPICIFIIGISSIYGILITLISRTELMAGVLGSSLAVLLSILGGTFVSFKQMPVILQQISIISPIRWLMEML